MSDDFSLKDERSLEAYNEGKARDEFGEEFANRLKKNQTTFKGDWWQLALLKKNLDEDAENPEIKAEHRLAKWNKSRKEFEYGFEYIHLEGAGLNNARLEGADFLGAHLEKAHFYEAHLEGATLSFARLKGAILRHAHLEGTNLMEARLEGAQLLEAHLKGANLEGANLEGAMLLKAHLEGANLEGARLEGAHLMSANLEGANLEYARLTEAMFEYARLEGAQLRQANLEGADLRGAKGILFDENSVWRTRFEGKPPDAWSVLRRKYTGPLFFVHLLLLILFFAPYAARVFSLSMQSRLYGWAQEQSERLSEMDRNDPRNWLREKYEKQHAIWILLGWHKGILYFGMASIVIFYNLLRVCLTFQVSGLRDAEERSHVTPKLQDYYGKYHPLAEVDKNGIKIIMSDSPPRERAKLLFQESVKASYNWPKTRIRRFFRFVMQKGGDETEMVDGLIAVLGLVRLHRFAKILLWAAIASVVINSLLWVWQTTVWVAIPK